MQEKLIRTIKAVSLKKLEEGSIGFLTVEEERWYNAMNEPEVLKSLTTEFIVKGNVIEFEIINGIPSNFRVIEKAKKQEKSGNFRDDMVDLEKLLDAGHKQGIKSVQIIKQDVQFGTDKNPIQAITQYRLTMKDECFFEATGDADKSNCTDMTGDAIIRMSETRALVRCLRWATNESKAADEEKIDSFK